VFKKYQLLLLLIMLVALSGVFTAAAQEGEQVLRIATGSSGVATFSFNTITAGGDQQNWITLQSVPPLYFDGDLNLTPGFFSAWESNEDGTVWSFTVDPRAQWSDGTPMTAQQVVDSWQIQIAPLNNVGRIRTYLGNVVGFAEAREAADPEAMSVAVDGLQVVDDATVQVSLVTPDPAFHWRIATAHMAVTRAENVLEYGFNEFWKPQNNPIVNGPFILTSLDENLQTAEMTPNPNWWMDEGPYLDKVTFQFVPDQQIIGAMVLNDQVDASLAPIPSALRAQVPDYFRPIQVIGYNTFWMAPSVEPTNDINVRKALILSVDWNQVFQAAFPIEGSGVPTTQPMDDVLLCWDPDLTGYPYDPDAAQAALAESSYGSAENLPKLRVTPRGNNEFNNRALQATMEFWRQNLGIENVEFQESPDGFGDDFPLINLSRDDVVIRFPDAATYMWAAGHTGGPVVGSEMLAGYNNPDLDAVVDEALTLDPDDPRRCELARQAQDLYINDYVQMHFGKPVATVNAREYVVGYNKGPDISLIEPWKIQINR
jgi:peptide/nickel transport system substrate-binding protein